MSWKDDFNDALLKFVQTRLEKPDAVEVTGFEQRAVEGAVYSEYTMDPDTIVVEITYRTAKRGGYLAEWEGDLAELIRSL